MTNVGVRPKNGVLEGLFVIGFHGRPDPDCTPARQQVVHADESDHLVVLHNAADGAVRAERAAAPLGPGPLPGFATRIGPWPARVGDMVVVLGRQDLEGLGPLRKRVENGRVTSLDGGLVAWCCAEDDAWEVWKAIAVAARAAVHRAVGVRDDERLKKAAWWLSRAAATDEDIFFAAAGLERAGASYAALLKQGIRDASAADLEAGLASARVRLGQRVARRTGTARDAVRARSIIRRAA